MSSQYQIIESILAKINETQHFCNGGIILRKLIIRFILSIIGLLIIVIGGFLAYATLTDYKPAAEESLLLRHPVTETLNVAKPFTVTTFNIGYGGLDKKQDFFMDGGKMSRSSSLEQTELNMEAIAAKLQELNSNLFLLQEVDTDSSRSYSLNEEDYLIDKMEGYSSVYATNYKSAWVPVPVFRPMGKVNSGILTLSNYHINNQTRYDLPGKEDWPVQLFELDRAAIETRLPVSNEKELIVLNVHLSAFDEGGVIRKQQLDFLSAYIEKQMAAGHYLIIGGDWNHVLPGTDPSAFPTTQSWPEWLQTFPEDFTPEGFKWAVDSDHATVRTLDTPYVAGQNFLAVIDGFLVSSNIEVVDVATTDMQFAYSDHHPVTATFKLIDSE